MAAMTTAATAPSDPIALLWKIARMWLADAIEAFGDPAEIARLLARKARRAARRRLMALESLVMKLLLIEAAKLTGVTRTHPHPRGERQQPAEHACVSLRRPAHAIDPADPATWRVRFEWRIPPEAAPSRKPASTGPRIRDLSPPLLVRDIFADRARRAELERMRLMRIAAPDEARERAKAEKLARRFEALRRVLAKPSPHARRLAARLRALGAAAAHAMRRIAMQAPPRGETNPVVHHHADFHCWRAITPPLADTS
jgi:hypothetical protein